MSRTFRVEQGFGRTPDELFPFFADAFNLELITPPFLKFRVNSPGPIRMEAGTAIDYRLRIHGIPVRWRSRITRWDPPHGFVDEQVRGPYRKWVHEHRFESVAGGTRMVDIVDYAAPGGRLVERLVVDRDVERIFAYRKRALEARFEPRGVDRGVLDREVPPS